MENIEIKMLKTVQEEGLFALLGYGKGLATPTVLIAGKTYPAVSNRHGAISGICDNGERLGVKPGEFEFVNAPEWILKIHEGVSNGTHT